MSPAAQLYEKSLLKGL